MHLELQPLNRKCEIQLTGRGVAPNGRCSHESWFRVTYQPFADLPQVRRVFLACDYHAHTLFRVKIHPAATVKVDGLWLSPSRMVRLLNRAYGPTILQGPNYRIRGSMKSIEQGYALPSLQGIRALLPMYERLLNETSASS